MPLVVALAGELHDGADSDLQLARGFLRCGGVRMCLAIWAWFIISSSLEGLSIRLLLLKYIL